MNYIANRLCIIFEALSETILDRLQLYFGGQDICNYNDSQCRSLCSQPQVRVCEQSGYQLDSGKNTGSFCLF